MTDPSRQFTLSEGLSDVDVACGAIIRDTVTPKLLLANAFTWVLPERELSRVPVALADMATLELGNCTPVQVADLAKRMTAVVEAGGLKTYSLRGEDATPALAVFGFWPLLASGLFSNVLAATPEPQRSIMRSVAEAFVRVHLVAMAGNGEAPGADASNVLAGLAKLARNFHDLMLAYENVGTDTSAGTGTIPVRPGWKVSGDKAVVTIRLADGNQRLFPVPLDRIVNGRLQVVVVRAENGQTLVNLPPDAKAEGGVWIADQDVWLDDALKKAAGHAKEALELLLTKELTAGEKMIAQTEHSMIVAIGKGLPIAAVDMLRLATAADSLRVVQEVA